MEPSGQYAGVWRAQPSDGGPRLLQSNWLSLARLKVILGKTSECAGKASGRLGLFDDYTKNLSSWCAQANAGQHAVAITTTRWKLHLSYEAEELVWGLEP